jgi:hypothetical protein
VTLTDDEIEHLRMAAVVMIESFTGGPEKVPKTSYVLHGFLLGHLQAYRGSGDIDAQIPSEDEREVQELAVEYRDTLLQAEAMNAA